MPKKQNLKNKGNYVGTLLVKFRNKDCKTTELGLLLQVLPVRIVTFVETLGIHLKVAYYSFSETQLRALRNSLCRHFFSRVQYLTPSSRKS